MTFRQWAVHYLESRGMWPDDAATLAAAVVADTPAMAGRWDEPTDGYPPSVQGVLAMALNRVALKFIDDTCPQAWYRDMFAPGGGE